MNLIVKNGFDFSYLTVSLHIKCIILTINSKNSLYEFNECDKLINDLLIYCEVKEIEKMKSFLEHNSTKVKFKKQIELPDQLSLF